MCLVQFQYNKTGFSIHNFLNGVKAQSARVKSILHKK